MVPVQTVWPLPPEEPRVRFVVAAARQRRRRGNAGRRTVDVAEERAPRKGADGVGAAGAGHVRQAVRRRDRRLRPRDRGRPRDGRRRRDGPAAPHVRDNRRDVEAGALPRRRSRWRWTRPTTSTSATRASRACWCSGPTSRSGRRSARSGELESPTGLAVDDDRHRLYVVDARTHAVLVFDLASAETAREDRRARHRARAQFNYPTGGRRRRPTAGSTSPTR